MDFGLAIKVIIANSAMAVNGPIAGGIENEKVNSM
jgi:hypothetical protein